MKIFNILIIFFISISMASIDFKEVKKFTLENIVNWYGNILRIDDSFYASDFIDKKIIEFDENGKILKKVGGSGKGPGEFGNLYYLSNFKDTIYVSDYTLYRLSIFDKELNFLNSFFIKRGYQDFITPYKTNLIMIGNNWTHLYDPAKDYNLGLVYTINRNGNYIFNKRIINIDHLPKLDILLPKGSDFKSDVGITAIKAIRLDDTIYIAFNNLPYIIKYDMKNDVTDDINIDFPNYVNPLKINYRKEEKLLNKHKNYMNISYNMQYSPIFFAYDEVSNHFIIQYNRPLSSILKSDNKKYFVTVIFNDKFQYIKLFYTNEALRCLFYQDEKAYLLASKSIPAKLSEIPDDFDEDNIHFIIYKIME